ncbi:hypothetical protein HERIO_1478 [Hepatospora eriocheir]|uniref:Uncharacterized protein n=1 Tax=Hepatospora eriocheir TaxID=1081669 RepID=A0A1X0QA77_9MICR|nr:hypothetical protein HERIO_1478 [Hepatospora eriocheir]
MIVLTEYELAELLVIIIKLNIILYNKIINYYNQLNACYNIKLINYKKDYLFDESNLINNNLFKNKNIKVKYDKNFIKKLESIISIKKENKPKLKTKKEIKIEKRTFDFKELINKFNQMNEDLK